MGVPARNPKGIKVKYTTRKTERHRADPPLYGADSDSYDLQSQALFSGILRRADTLQSGSRTRQAGRPTNLVKGKSGARTFASGRSLALSVRSSFHSELKAVSTGTVRIILRRYMKNGLRTALESRGDFEGSDFTLPSKFRKALHRSGPEPVQNVSFNPSCITRLLPEPMSGLPATTSGVPHPQPNV